VRVVEEEDGSQTVEPRPLRMQTALQRSKGEGTVGVDHEWKLEGVERRQIANASGMGHHAEGEAKHEDEDEDEDAMPMMGVAVASLLQSHHQLGVATVGSLCFYPSSSISASCHSRLSHGYY